ESRAVVPARSSRHGISCSWHLSRTQAEIPLIRAVQISRATSVRTQQKVPRWFEMGGLRLGLGLDFYCIDQLDSSGLGEMRFTAVVSFQLRLPVS
ncbi:hypothetical protein F9K76_17390, partial [Brucella anthropi]